MGFVANFSVSQTLQHLTEGATYIQQGGHHVGHWPTSPHSSVMLNMLCVLNLVISFCYK